MLQSPIILFCFSMMYKYFIRIRDMPNNRILHSAFITDQELFRDKSKSWFSNVATIMKLLNIDIKEEPIDHATFVHLLKEYYMQQTECQLNKIKHNVVDSKLSVSSHILDINYIPKYLSLISEISMTKEITKLRLRAHYLNIEKGKFTKPKTPRNDRICPHYTFIEAEIHFFTECHRYCIPRKKLYEDFICSVFFVSKGNLFDVYFTTLQLVLVPCGGG